jgi:N-carbamoyl-L-amino-acid hydrolase
MGGQPEGGADRTHPTLPHARPADVVALIRSLDGIGRDPRGGWSRHLFTDADTQLREWFAGEATARGLDVEVDRNANMWAWWRPPGTERERTVATGSHLDSVPGGGAYDGPLGVASAFAALDLLWTRRARPRRPLAIVAFAEEEGGRFGVGCLGSRLMTGATTAWQALALRDPDGTTLTEAAARSGVDVSRVGPDPDRVAALDCLVELHIEQGGELAAAGPPVALVSSLLARGRWRMTFEGSGNHAGATPMDRRRDPMVPAARTVLAARERAGAEHLHRATVGRLTATPGGTNVVPCRATVWLDARAPTDESVRALVGAIAGDALGAAGAEGCRVEVTEESFGGSFRFDERLRDRLRALLARPTSLARLGGAGIPVLGQGAGHDAAVLGAAARTGGALPTAMIMVRNPTGVSHAPAEHAEDDDCRAGVEALATTLTELLTTEVGG